MSPPRGNCFLNRNPRRDALWATQYGIKLLVDALRAHAMARTAHGGHSGWSLHSSRRIAGYGAWPAWLHAPRSSVLLATCGETYSAISPAMRGDTLRSVREVVDDGLTGFIVEDEGGAVGAFDRLSQL